MNNVWEVKGPKKCPLQPMGWHRWVSVFTSPQLIDKCVHCETERVHKGVKDVKVKGDIL